MLHLCMLTNSLIRMEIHTFFLQLLTILLAARFFAEIAVRFQFPAVIGELFAGILLGPSLLGWIDINEAIRLSAEFGIILLLFEVGLKTEIERLTLAGGKSLIVACAGFFLPLILGFAVSYYLFKLSLLVSLFIGGTLTATSIGITIRVLMDLNRDQSAEGNLVLGAAVIDDIWGVVMLALLYEFAFNGNVSLISVGKIILFVGLFFVIAPVTAKLMAVVIKRLENKSKIPGLIPTTIFSLVLFYAWLAHNMGVPLLLGGFAAGLALSRGFFLPYGSLYTCDLYFPGHVEKEMKPIIQLFTPVFFVLVGLSLNLKEIDWSSSYIWLLSLSLFVVAVVGKVLSALMIKETLRTRWAVGIAMVARGEVGLIFAELGRKSDLFNNEVYASMIFVIALSTLFPPFALRWFYGRYFDEKLNDR